MARLPRERAADTTRHSPPLSQHHGLATARHARPRGSGSEGSRSWLEDSRSLTGRLYVAAPSQTLESSKAGRPNLDEHLPTSKMLPEGPVVVWLLRELMFPVALRAEGESCNLDGCPGYSEAAVVSLR